MRCTYTFLSSIQSASFDSHGVYAAPDCLCKLCIGTRPVSQDVDFRLTPRSAVFWVRLQKSFDVRAIKQPVIQFVPFFAVIFLLILSCRFSPMQAPSCGVRQPALQNRKVSDNWFYRLLPLSTPTIVFPASILPVD